MINNKRCRPFNTNNNSHPTTKQTTTTGWQTQTSSPPFQISSRACPTLSLETILKAFLGATTFSRQVVIKANWWQPKETITELNLRLLEKLTSISTLETWSTIMEETKTKVSSWRAKGKAKRLEGRLLLGWHRVESSRQIRGLQLRQLALQVLTAE